MKIRQFKIIVTDNLEGEKEEELNSFEEWKKQIAAALLVENINLIEIIDLELEKKEEQKEVDRLRDDLSRLQYPDRTGE